MLETLVERKAKETEAEKAAAEKNALLVEALLAIPFFLGSEVIAAGVAAAGKTVETTFKQAGQDVVKSAKELIEANREMGKQTAEAASHSARVFLAQKAGNLPSTPIEAVIAYIESFRDGKLHKAGEKVKDQLKASNNIWDYAVVMATVEAQSDTEFEKRFAEHLEKWHKDVTPTLKAPLVMSGLFQTDPADPDRPGDVPHAHIYDLETTKVIVHAEVGSAKYLVRVGLNKKKDHPTGFGVKDSPLVHAKDYFFDAWVELDGPKAETVDYKSIRDFPLDQLDKATKVTPELAGEQ